MKNRITALLAIIILSSGVSHSQHLDKEKQYAASCIAFYNFENLFDTIVDPDPNKILQDDFTPNGKNVWNTERYHKKLDNIAYVVSQLGVEVNPDGPAILGVAEIENQNVLDDFVKEEKIKSRNYQVVHYDSPDKRGIDVGLLYNPSYFQLESSKTFSVKMEGDSSFFTRDQLLVTGKLHDERIHVIVAHWPSRRGGQKKSAPKRMAAAEVGRAVIDSILKSEPNAKIVYMGDLNDDPVSPSVVKGMHSKGNKHKIKEGDMFNPMEEFYDKGIGTLAWKDVWNLFDQIMITPSLVNGDYSSYTYYSAKVFNKDFLKQSTGKYKGYPHRTFAGGNYAGGYSDHFPSYIFVIKELK